MPASNAALIDPRQRIAAAITLLAMDLPAEMAAAAQIWKLAGRVAPKGADLKELMLGAPRLDMLRRARDLIQEMIDEAVP